MPKSVITRHLGLLFIMVLALSVSSQALAQMVWRKEAGQHRVLLFKEVQRDFYYCTWSIELDPPPNFAAFDLIAGRPLMFRIRWKNEFTEDTQERLFMHAIIDGADFPFLISKVNREKYLTDVVGEFGFSPGQQSSADLWDRLGKAKMFRVYLPSGQFKEAQTAGFPESVTLLNKCVKEAAVLNKATGK